MMNQKVLNPDGQSELKINYLNSYDEGHPSILLIHGWGSSSGIWTNSTEKLALSFNLLTVDLPGHGEHAELGLSSINDFIYKIKMRMPVENFSVIGWSLGGVIDLLHNNRKKGNSISHGCNKPIIPCQT